MTSPLGSIERTPDGGTVTFERDLAFGIDDVWSAITEPERLADWWPPFATDVAVDLREGGTMSFAWPDPDFPKLEFRIIRLEPPTLLEHTHTSPGAWMRWELEPHGSHTRLRATYFMPDPDMAIQRGDVVGGHYSIDRLAAALAGTPIPWDNDAFAALAAAYTERGLAPVE